MENFEGTFKQIKSENFDDYLKEVGVNFLLRKVAGAANASIEFKNNGDGTWTFYFYSTVKNGTWRFKVGEESEETTPDGRHVMSTISIEDGKLVHRQKAIKSSDRDSLIIRTRVGDEIHSTISCNGVVATAIDKKQ